MRKKKLYKIKYTLSSDTIHNYCTYAKNEIKAIKKFNNSYKYNIVNFVSIKEYKVGEEN